MNRLIDQIDLKITVSKELEHDLSTAFVKMKVKKNNRLLNEGQMCDQFYFLENGIVRSFYYKKGKDVTSWIFSENQFFTSWYSFYQNQPSFDHIETVSDCNLCVIAKSDFEALLEKHISFSNFSRLLSEQQLAYSDLYLKGYKHMSAKERYLQLLHHFPHIELYMKLRHIASYLGITQETLSRIRAQR